MSETLESYCEYYKRPCTVSDGLCSECGERLIEPASGATEESPKTKGMTNGKQRVEEILQKYSNAVVDEAVEKCVGGGIVVFAERAKAKRLEALDSIEEIYKEEEARMSLPNVLPTYYKHSCPNDIHVFVVLDDTETCIYCWVGDNPPKNQVNKGRWESK